MRVVILCLVRDGSSDYGMSAVAFLFFSSPAGSNPDGRENGTDALRKAVREIQQILHGNISDSAGERPEHIFHRQVWDSHRRKTFFRRGTGYAGLPGNGWFPEV